MIHALPDRRNMVLVRNDATSQTFQGLSWFGSDSRPLVTIVKGQPGDKPITVSGYEILCHDGCLVSYGTKNLLRYTIDNIDPHNQLFISNPAPGAAEGLLARWLVRKGGDMVTNDGILRIMDFIRRNATVLSGWCTVEEDLFIPDNKGYLIFGEPPADVLKTILKSATRNIK
jgi:hypothetical protein